MTRATGAIDGRRAGPRAIVRARAAARRRRRSTRRDAGRRALTRFATSFIHQNVAEEREPRPPPGRARRADGDRHASTGRPTTTRSAGSSTTCSRPRGSPGRPRLAGPDAADADVPPIDHWDDGDRGARPPTTGRAVVGAFVDGGRRPRDRRLLLDRRRSARRTRTRAGQRRPAARRRRRSTGSPGRRRSDGCARADVRARSPTSTAATPGERAARKARDGEAAERPGARAATRSSSSRRRVADVLEFLFIYGFNGRGGRGGPLVRPARRAQFDPSITLRDDVADPGMVGLGVRRRRHAAAARRPRRRRRHDVDPPQPPDGAAKAGAREHRPRGRGRRTAGARCRRTSSSTPARPRRG